MDINKQEELAFNKRYSRFKVQIFFKRRPAITHYGNERTGCTVAQMKFGHIKNVLLNRAQGLQDCIDRIGICKQLYGAYQTAIIYDRKKTTTLEDGTVQNGREIIKYICGELVESENPFDSESEKKVRADVVHYSENGNPFFKLLPFNFQQEVAKALERSG